MALDGPLLEPTPTTGGGLPSGGDSAVGARAISAEEHQQAIIRFRRVLTIGTPAWFSFLAVDWLACHAYGDGRFLPLLLLRAAAGFVIGAAALRINSARPVSPLVLKLLDQAIFISCNLSVALMCLRLGGVVSPYGPGIAVTLSARMLLVNEPWKQGARWMVLPVLTWPVTMLVAFAFDPAIAQQLATELGRTTFLLTVAYSLMAALFLVLEGHVFWALRRQLFENRLLGRYRLKHRLAAGGMGEVWAAYHPSLKRDVAVKVLRANRGDQIALARFEREVKATAELTHPNTIRIFDFGVTDDGVWFYVMELLTGMDLATLVKRVGPLSPGRAVHLVTQAARALAEAHRRGIVHRDIKPHNIFSCAVGGEVDYVKVLDFGIARTVDAPAVEAHLTATGTVPGTPKYMAPEVSIGQQAMPASDVYSLAAVMFFLLTGKAPFEIDNVSQLLMAQQSRPPDPPSRVRGEPLPAELEALIMRCLSKEPVDRLADAGAFATELSALPSLPREASPAFPLEPSPEVSALRPRARPDDPTRELGTR
jgi:serine/threonine-protein kinase